MKGEVPYDLPLPRVAYVIISFLILCLSSSTFYAGPALMELFELNGTFGEVASDPDERRGMILRIVGLPVTASMFAAFPVGIINDLVGPKLSGILGQGLLLLGYLMWFIVSQPASDMAPYVGSILVGVGYVSTFNAYTSVASLFPDGAPIVLSIIGSGPDINLMVPLILVKLARRFPVHLVIIFYLGVIGVCVLLNLLFIPLSQFAPEIDREPIDAAEADIEDEGDDDDEKRLLTGNGSLNSAGELLPPWRAFLDWPFSMQVTTAHFWLALMYFNLTIVRKVFYYSSILDVFKELLSNRDPSLSEADIASAAQGYVDLYSAVSPFGFICAMLWGVFRNKCGIHTTIFTHTAVTILSFGCGMIGTIPMQLASILFYLFYSSYAFGIAFATVATYFGFRNLSSLMGIQMFVCGLLMAALPSITSMLLALTGGSYMRCYTVFFWISVASSTIPIMFKMLDLGHVTTKPQTPLPVEQCSGSSREAPNVLQALEARHSLLI